MKFFDLSKQYSILEKEIDGAVKKVMQDSYFIGGKEVQDFEHDMAQFCNVKYCAGMNSGTDALFLALRALNIKEGDEVITTPFTFIATAEVIANCQAKPVFVDIDPKTFNIDPQKIEEKITERTKAIIPVHIFGQMADMDKIVEIANKHKLFIIEDACQAIGAQYKGKMAGSIGDISAFSFFPTKNLGACADGGAAITNNSELAKKIFLLKNHGSSSEDKYKHLIVGMNSRLDAIQAAILRVKFRYLNEWNQKRLEIAQYYTKNLSNIKGIECPQIDDDCVHIFHQYTLKSERRDELFSFLKERDIPSMIYYQIPLHLQEAFGYLGYQVGDFPVAESACQSVLSLPIYPELSRDDQDLIIKTIKEFFN
ncbi:MAG TPA: DegT/DnrJ/EryC1/StrS family aminotransferase [Candidatus Pacearchaeota archaeon]|nr:DegT/DnrJ/EryC1/StrS family aminotransferase [Candidatus Parcubacteria bacterium]HNZ83834.1 DegT/DnrJ/EryC1/StrS family aminotransferase [Candidatus Pacearchaeota archaeon]